MKVSQKDGVKALWNGLAPSLMLVSNPSINFVVYDRLKTMAFQAKNPVYETQPDAMFALEDIPNVFVDTSIIPLEDIEARLAQAVTYVEHANPDLSSFEYLLLGGLAKMVATLTTYPLQVAQTRLRAAKDEDKTTLDCLREIYTNDGVQGLYKGMNAKLVQTCLNSAFMFLLYERINRFFFLLLLRRKFKKVD